MVTSKAREAIIKAATKAIKLKVDITKAATKAIKPKVGIIKMLTSTKVIKVKVATKDSKEAMIHRDTAVKLNPMDPKTIIATRLLDCEYSKLCSKITHYLPRAKYKSLPTKEISF